MTETYRYKAFISYSHRDKAAGDRLLKDLENYRVPKRLVGKAAASGTVIPGSVGHIFRDRDELPSAEDLTAEVKKALTQSEFMIVLCSPAAAASRWVNREIIEFKKLTGERRILSVILSGEPFATHRGTPEEECLPPALRFKLGKDGTLTNTPAEPLAADFRPEGDGQRRGLLKLIAGLLGIGLDALIERDLQRKMRRVMAVTAVSVAAMIGMASLTYEAVTARQDAERHRGEAEGLIEFMLTDLRDKLEPVGRLDVLDAVGEKAVDYYDRQALDDMPDDALGRRARAFHLLGEIDDKQGDLEGARGKFEAAYLTTATQLAQDPNNPDRIFDHSQSAFWVGYYTWQTNQYENAESYFLDYRDLATRLVEIDPENTSWLLEKAYTAQNLGTLYLRGFGQPQRALTIYEEALENYEAVAATKPEERSIHIGLADVHAWLADTNRILGNLDKAWHHRQRQFKVYSSFVERVSDDPGLISRQLNNQASIAQLEIEMGREADALKRLQNTAEKAQEILDYDPANKRWLELAGRYHNHLARAALASGDLDIANKSLAFVNNILVDLEGLGNLSNANKVRVKYESILIGAHIAFLAQNHEVAAEMIEEIFLFIEPEFGLKSPRATLQKAQVYFLRGLTRSARREEALARKDWETVVSILMPSLHSLGLEANSILMPTYTLSGMTDEALEQMRILRNKKYDHPEYRIFLRSINIAEQ